MARNRLTQEQFFLVCMWVKDNEQKQVIRNASIVDIAGRASAKLKFNVLPEHIKRAGKTLNIDWLQQDFRGSEQKRSPKRDLAILTRLVYDLYDKWEDTIPEELTRLQNKYNH